MSNTHRELTLKQRAVLDFIRHTIDLTSLPPTRKQIQLHFNWASPNAAQDVLCALSSKGAIELLKGTARGIRVRDGAPRSGCVHDPFDSDNTLITWILSECSPSIRCKCCGKWAELSAKPFSSKEIATL